MVVQTEGTKMQFMPATSELLMIKNQSCTSL